MRLTLHCRHTAALQSLPAKALPPTRYAVLIFTPPLNPPVPQHTHPTPSQKLPNILSFPLCANRVPPSAGIAQFQLRWLNHRTGWHQSYGMSAKLCTSLCMHCMCGCSQHLLLRQLKPHQHTRQFCFGGLYGTHSSSFYFFVLRVQFVFALPSSLFL